MKLINSIIFTVEPFALFVILVAFWGSSLDRLPTLLIIIPIIISRVIIHRRFIPNTPLTIFLVALLILSVLNILIAPFTWSWWIIGRVLMGLALATSIAERARVNGSTALEALLSLTTALALGLGIVGLYWSQWTEKSIQLQGIIDLIPPAPTEPLFENLFGRGFNVNEIAGAMAWMIVLVGVIAIVDWRRGDNSFQIIVRKPFAVIAFLLLAVDLMLGQSRFAIAGVLFALGIVNFLLMPRGKVRRIGFLVLILVTAFEIFLVSQISNPQADALIQRDENSAVSRLLIWDSGITMLRDYPLTGVGMNKFRSREVRALYPVEGYDVQVLPHAHNEWVQIGADYGIPGLIVFNGIYAATGWMLWQVWKQRSNEVLGRLAVGIGAALLAHAIFGLGDAITLFDRFIFIFWWLIGLAMAVYIAHQAAPLVVSAKN